MKCLEVSQDTGHCDTAKPGDLPVWGQTELPRKMTS